MLWCTSTRFAEAPTGACRICVRPACAPLASVAQADLVDDEEMLNLVELEMRSVLKEYGFDGDNTPFIRGSALCALEDRNPSLGEDSIRALLKAVDEYIPMPPRDLDKPFLMPIEDVFSISGRGTVVCVCVCVCVRWHARSAASATGTWPDRDGRPAQVSGRVERGVVNKGDDVEIIGYDCDTKTTITGLEMFHKQLDRGEAGDNLGALLRGTKREARWSCTIAWARCCVPACSRPAPQEVFRGQLMVAPGSMKSSRKIAAELYVLKQEEGGRHTPFANHYRPQMYFRTCDVTASLLLPEGREMVMPGDNCTVTMELASKVPVENGIRFTLREGNRTIGTGVVTKILE